MSTFHIEFSGLCLFDFPFPYDPSAPGRVILPFGLFGYQHGPPENPDRVESHTAFIAAPPDAVVATATSWPVSFDFEDWRVFPISHFVHLSLQQGFSDLTFTRTTTQDTVVHVRAICGTFQLADDFEDRAAVVMYLDRGKLDAYHVKDSLPVHSFLELTGNGHEIVLRAASVDGHVHQITLRPGTSFTIGNKYTGMFSQLDIINEPLHWTLYYKLAQAGAALCGPRPPHAGDTTVGCSNSNYP